jgi:hypothetical protein
MQLKVGRQLWMQLKVGRQLWMQIKGIEKVRTKLKLAKSQIKKP